MWIEMSRDEAHGGKGWAFAECLWSPAKKQNGANWAFWNLLLNVKKDDVIVHLRGIGKQAAFVGWSIADSDGYETSSKPTDAAQWSYAESFYRVPLIDFRKFADPIPLDKIFWNYDKELRDYFVKNAQKNRSQKEHLFYVVQSNRLQCLNGAYLSELSDDLAQIIFGIGPNRRGLQEQPSIISVPTGEQLVQMFGRRGQKKFSDMVAENYGVQCCFPGCTIDERRFLVGSHIARWADAEHLRGENSNGLCLCLFHDRAFEYGFYTLTSDLRIAINTFKAATSLWVTRNLNPFAGERIRSGIIPPSVDALRKHWERIHFVPANLI